MASSSSTMDPRPKGELTTRLWTNSFAEDLGTVLWTTSKYKDIDIFIGGRVLRVHKCVLAARSPVFATMFQSGLTETTLDQVNIQDFDYNTVESAIKFCYSQLYCFGPGAKIIWNLLKFGNKYGIAHLMKACLLQLKYRVHGYKDSEKKFLITSGVILGCDEILDPILSIFGVIKGELVPDSTLYPALGDALLVQDESFKDLQLLCGGQQFSVHKCILDLTSPVFAQMLNKTTFVLPMCLLISGIELTKSEVFGNAIQFFYTGSFTNEFGPFDNPNLLMGLLKFADQFKAEELVSYCLSKIRRVKNRLDLDQEIISKFISTCATFESKKIYHFILGIFGINFSMKKATKESYWK